MAVINEIYNYNKVAHRKTWSEIKSSDEQYKKDCWKKIPVTKTQLVLAEIPGAGIDEFKPFETVLKGGFMGVNCVKDKMYLHGDKFGDNKHDYTLEGVSNVSIVHYQDHVPKEDRKSMTIKACFEFCRTVPDMLFFGITNGRDCYCTPYYQQMAGDSSQCDLPCDGDPGVICGGKFKSSIFEMHFCDSWASDLKKAGFDAITMAGDLKTRVDMAIGLGESMQKAAEKNQKIFGQAGDPATTGLMQAAKMFAGTLEHTAVNSARISKSLKKAVGESRKLKKFTDPDVVAKAESLMEKMTADVAEGKDEAAKLGDVIALASPGKEWDGAAEQYYPLMYFVDKEYKDVMQSCDGDMLDKPIVGETMDGCAAACDALMNAGGKKGCVGFSYYGTADDALCFLFSKFKTAVYWTGCDKKDSAALVQSSPHSLIQTILRGPVTVKPWACGSVGQPFQIINSKNTKDGKSNVLALDVKTGKYDLVFEIKKEWTKPKFDWVNACAINPVDSIIYCHMKLAKKYYLVRIDNTQVGFVGKVPSSWWSGTFDEDGDFYGYAFDKLWILKNVKDLPAFDSQKAKLADFTRTPPYKSTIGADMAVVKANFDGEGVKKYALAVHGSPPALTVVLIDPQPMHTWKLKAEGLDKSMGKAWGATWTFKHEVYFSCNKGKGVYQLDLATVDIVGETATFTKAGSSVATKSNDGMNCPKGRSPFPPVLPPAKISTVGGSPPQPPAAIVGNEEALKKQIEEKKKEIEEKKEALKKQIEEKKEAEVKAEPLQEKEAEVKAENLQEEIEEEKEEDYAAEPLAVPPKSGEVRCLAKLSRFEGTTVKPNPSGKCEGCLKELTHADRCY